MNVARYSIWFFVLSAALGVTGRALAKTPRIETKIGFDSTIFSIKLEPGARPKAGKTFRTKIHVGVHKGWHVYSSKMSSGDGLCPFELHVPDELSAYYEIVGLKENGDIVERYDSNFMSTTEAHYTPFDLIATVKVKENSDSAVPFYVYVHFQTCNENQCMPPRYFAIPMTVRGEQPLALKIARGKIYKGAHRAKPKNASAKAFLESERMFEPENQWSSIKETNEMNERRGVV